MASDPDLRERMLRKIEQERTIKATTIKELRSKFGESETSSTQFRKALGSLQYHYGKIRVFRPHSVRSHYGPRVYEVICAADVSRIFNPALVATV